MARSPDRFLLPYCVVLGGLVRAPKTGVQGAEVHVYSTAGLTVLYSNLPSKDLPRETLPRAALEFWEVIRLAFEKGAVIPFRFPTWISKAELGKHLQARAEDYVAFLRQLANYVQMEVRVTPRYTDDDRFSVSPSGTEYMEKLQRWKRWIVTLPFTFEEITRVRARSWHHRDDGNAVRMFALVERQNATEFGERLAEFNDLANVSIRVSGPWPATEFLP
jgi:Gas vesicle synthesis protein GvpL/GvpF.